MMKRYAGIRNLGLLGAGLSLSLMSMPTYGLSEVARENESAPVVMEGMLAEHEKRLARIVASGSVDERPAHYVAFVSAEFHKIPGVDFDLPVVKLVFKEEVFFDFDEVVIRERAYSRLQLLAMLIEAEPAGTAIFIAGHTDSVGPEDYNSALSDRRSFAVTEYLLNHVSGDARFYRVGFGETLPVATNATEEGRAKNRRVEFFFASHKGAVEGYLQQQSINRDNSYFHDGKIPPTESITILETSKQIDGQTGHSKITDEHSGKIQLNFEKKKTKLRVS